MQLNFFYANENAIDNAIEKANFVAIEGGFDELLDQTANPIPVIDDDAIFFQKIIERSWKHDKPILYTDPQIGLLNSLEMGEAIFEASFLPILFLHLLRGNRNLTRRQFLVLSGLFLGDALVFSTNSFGRSWLSDRFIPSCNTEPLPWLVTHLFSYDDYRNSGTVLGLHQSAKEKYCEDEGVYFVGNHHVKHYLSYGKSIETAKQAFTNNINHLIRSGFNNIPQIKLWSPDKNVPYKYDLKRSMPLAVNIL